MMRRSLAFAALALTCVTALSACSIFEDKKKPLPGQRISVLQLQQKLEPVRDGAAQSPFQMPAQLANDSWPQAGGSPDHAPENLGLGRAPLTLAWKADIGKGANASRPLTTQPIVAEGKVFTVDRNLVLSAFNAMDGKRQWQVTLETRKEKNAVIGGGIAYNGGVLYATNGFTDLFALSPGNGHMFWHVTLPTPSRAAPTVLNGRVYVVTLDDRLMVFDARTGKPMWDYTGVAETAGLVGASSPAVTQESAVVGFSSGELDALLAANGSVEWSENLGQSRFAGGLSSIPDIKGLPVVSKGVVYAVNFGGKMVAIDMRSGNRIWQKDLSSDVTPWVAGNAVVVLTLDNELTALDRGTGAIRWVLPLQRYTDQKDRTSDPVFWTGAVMGGDRLIVAGTNGKIAEIDPATGKITRDWKIDYKVSLPLVIANRTLYIATDEGTLLAYR